MPRVHHNIEKTVEPERSEPVKEIREEKVVAEVAKETVEAIPSPSPIAEEKKVAERSSFEEKKVTEGDSSLF